MDNKKKEKLISISCDMYRLQGINPEIDTEKEIADKIFSEIKEDAKFIMCDENGDYDITPDMMREFEMVDCPIGIYRVIGNSFNISISRHGIGVVIDTVTPDKLFLKK